MAVVTQLVHQLELESMVVVRVYVGLLTFDLSFRCSSLIMNDLDNSLACMECPTSSKFSVASPPACSLRTSSPPGCSCRNLIRWMITLRDDQPGAFAVVVLLNLFQGVVLHGLFALLGHVFTLWARLSLTANMGGTQLVSQDILSLLIKYLATHTDF